MAAKRDLVLSGRRAIECFKWSNRVMVTRRLFLGLSSLLALPGAALAAVLSPDKIVPAERSVRILIHRGADPSFPTNISVRVQGAVAGDLLRIVRQGGYPSGYSRIISDRDIRDGTASVEIKGSLSSTTGSGVYLVEVQDPSGLLLAASERDLSAWVL